MTDQRERARVDVLHTMDAQVWAQEFMRLFAFRKQDIDESLMLGWFANAIMAGFDEANRRHETALADAGKWQKELTTRGRRLSEETNVWDGTGRCGA